MNWVSMWEYLSGQGIMFWSATAAVALGFTLILTAVHIQWRRRSRPAKHNPAMDAKIPPTLPDPAPVKSSEDMDPQSGKSPLQPPTTFQGQDHFEIGGLMSRLRSAADRLAAYQGSRSQNPTVLTDSHLKEDPNGVEYLFRAGKG